MDGKEPGQRRVGDGLIRGNKRRSICDDLELWRKLLASHLMYIQYCVFFYYLLALQEFGFRASASLLNFVSEPLQTCESHKQHFIHLNCFDMEAKDLRGGCVKILGK